jgi:hypothetical protein
MPRPYQRSYAGKVVVRRVVCHGTGHGFACQISAAYCAIVASLENLRELATLKMALRAHASPSAYNCVSRGSASR